MRLLLSFGLVAVFTVLTACSSPRDEGLYFAVPTPDAARVLDLGGESTAQTSRLVVARLQAAGFTVQRVSPSGQIQALSRSRANLDCGTFEQLAFGNTGEFPGNSDLAVVFTSRDPVEFLSRRFSSQTAVTVTVKGGLAQVSQTHEVTITLRKRDKGPQAIDKRLVTNDARVRFSDGTVCTSSDRVASIVGTP